GAARLDEVLRLHLEPARGDARSDGRERDEGLEELLDAVAVEVAEDGDDARGLAERRGRARRQGPLADQEVAGHRDDERREQARAESGAGEVGEPELEP